MQHHFPARFDTFAKSITSIVLIIPLIPLTMATAMADRSTLFFSGVFLLFTIGIAWALHPQAYTLTPEELIINRPFANVKIPLHQIRDVKQITASDIGFSWRLFASGGLFGYFGVFTSRNIGTHTMWCRNRRNMVMIVLEEKIVIVSPDDPAGFVEDVKRIGKF